MVDPNKYYRVKRRTVEWALGLLAQGDLERLRVVLESMVNDDKIAQLRAERKAAWEQLQAGTLTPEEYYEVSNRVDFFLP